MPERGTRTRIRTRELEPAPAAPMLAPSGWQTVDRAWYHGRQLLHEDHVTEAVAVPLFHGAVAHVGVDGGITRNTGDFNSVRVRVSVTLPCYPEDSEIRRAYIHASNLIDELLPAELDKALGNDPQPATDTTSL